MATQHISFMHEVGGILSIRAIFDEYSMNTQFDKHLKLLSYRSVLSSRRHVGNDSEQDLGDDKAVVS
jgi:hypothetical protein